MNNMEKSAAVLNDLVRINNDRIAGYQKAIENLQDEDADLKTAFTEFIKGSHQNKMELVGEVSANGNEVNDDTTLAGDIYHGWQDLKAMFTGHDRKSILENCEFGEDAAQKAYQKALENENLSANSRSIVREQKNNLKIMHDRVKVIRDNARF